MNALTAAQLRADFDRSFAAALADVAPSREDFLSIRVGEDRHALRLTEVAQLMPLTAMTPLPGPLPVLLGIIGLRGAIVPVYDLRRLLGHAASQSPHWLVVAAGEPAVALAFDLFDGHLRLSHATQLGDAGHDTPRRNVRELLNTADGVCPVVSLASLRESIKTMVQRSV